MKNLINLLPFVISALHQFHWHDCCCFFPQNTIPIFFIGLQSVYSEHQQAQSFSVDCPSSLCVSPDVLPTVQRDSQIIRDLALAHLHTNTHMQTHWQIHTQEHGTGRDYDAMSYKAIIFHSNTKDAFNTLYLVHLSE